MAVAADIGLANLDLDVRAWEWPQAVENASAQDAQRLPWLTDVPKTPAKVLIQLR